MAEITDTADTPDTNEALLLRRGEKSFHPFSLFAHKPKPQEWLQEAQNWILDESKNGFETCRGKNGKRMKCSCFALLQDPSIAACVAEYLYFFGTSPAHERDRIVMDMIRFQEDRKPPEGFQSNRHYLFPYIAGPSEDDDVQTKQLLRSHFVCVNALQHLLSYGTKKMRRIRTDINNGLFIPRRPRLGIPLRNSLDKKGVLDDLHLFFDDLSEYEEPRATRFVREATGVSARDDGIIDLPSYMTKRGLYRDFCFERGVIAQTTATGKPIYKTRTDDLWKASGLEPLKCPSWSTFVSFWKEHYSQVRIQKQIKDICGDCYRFQINNRKKGYTPGDDNDDDSDIDIDEIVQASALLAEEAINEVEENVDVEVDKKGDTQQDDTLIGTVDIQLDANEEIMLAASTHITDAIAQRKYVAQEQKRAQSTHAAGLPNDEKVFLLFFDYAQNVECPFFGHQQPGETYYFSPLSINIFGIVNACGPKEQLTAYCYHEGQGKKGGNNVTSMIDYYLRKQLGVPRISMDPEREPVWGGELVLVCDNCGGQNKNRMVIRYALYLVETKKFKRVTFVFLIAGHTKNPCDRLFNSLKAGYRKRNLFSVEELISALNENEFCSAETAPRFADWDTFLNTFYQKPRSVKKWHVFEVDGRNGENEPLSRSKLKFFRSAAEGSTRMTQQMRPNTKNIIDDRDYLLMHFAVVPKAINQPGIRPIKKREMWKKFRPVVPEKYHSLDIYECPTLAELEELKKERAKKAQEKRKSSEAASVAASKEAEEARKRKWGDGNLSV